MAPTSGLPEKTTQVTWTLQRPWASPTCEITNKIIWPWHMAWRRRTDYLYDGSVYLSKDEWVTENSYLLLKLKGEVY